MKKKGINIALGKAIRQRRKELGFNQESFSDHVSMHRTYIGGIERGERNITIDVLSRLSKGLSCKMSHLLEEAESELE